jgi:hypothetical protein
MDRRPAALEQQRLIAKEATDHPEVEWFKLKMYTISLKAHATTVDFYLQTWCLSF